MKRLFLLLSLLFTLVQGASARQVVLLNDNWRFYFSSENSADYARTISLPHTWTYDQSNIFVLSQPTTANYIKEIYIPSEWSEKRLFIKFYGVQSVADIIVNGRYVGDHRGGATAFTFELTKSINFGQTNIVQVIVNNAPHSDVLPTSHEEDLYGGIYRDVELIVTDKSIVSPLYYGSDGVFVETTKANESTAEGEVRVHLNSPTSNTCQMTLSIFDPEGEVVYQKVATKAKIGAEAVSVPFVVTSPRLWSPDEPNLYTFSVSVNDGSGGSDKVEVSSGFRTIEYLDEGYISINDKPIQFRSVALYHDYPHVGGAASKRDIEADMAIIEEVGANAIRSISHPHHQYLYEMCNTSGKLVWIDFPLVKAPFLSDIAYYPTARFHEQGRETLREIIAQNYNHPSVVMWGIFSLLTTRGDNPIPYVTEINELAKSIDTTRPTVAVSDQDGDINKITDLIVWNQSIGWDRGLFSDLDVWSNMLHTNWSMMRSAVIYGQSGRMDQQSEESKYKSSSANSAYTWKPEGRQRVFHEEYSSRLLADSLFWGVCLNSMFDFKSARNSLGENNSGLVSFDRRSRKDIFYLYKACWNRAEPTLHIADKLNSVSTSELHKVVVYSSDTVAPMLYTQRDTIPMKPRADWCFVVDSILLDEGSNKFVVRQGDLADSTEVVLQRSSSALRRLRSTTKLK